MAQDAIDPIELQDYLAGLEFPTSKFEMLAVARENGAPQDVLDTIERFPADRFEDENDVLSLFGADEDIGYDEENADGEMAQGNGDKVTGEEAGFHIEQAGGRSKDDSGGWEEGNEKENSWE